MHHQAFSIHFKNGHSDFGFKCTPNRVEVLESGVTYVLFVWEVALHEWATGNQYFETNTFSWNNV